MVPCRRDSLMLGRGLPQRVALIGRDAKPGPRWRIAPPSPGKTAHPAAAIFRCLESRSRLRPKQNQYSTWHDGHRVGSRFPGLTDGIRDAGNMPRSPHRLHFRRRAPLSGTEIPAGAHRPQDRNQHRADRTICSFRTYHNWPADRHAISPSNSFKVVLQTGL